MTIRSRDNRSTADAWRPHLAGRTGRFLLASLVIVALASAAQAQPAPIANVDDVNPNAFALFGGQQITVVQGVDLFEGQTITTDARGLVQIVFADETRMVVGPNSQLVIERYLMRDPNTVSEFVANALGGTFRFLSGNSPSDAYRINTPGGTIGVRGTVFDLTIDNLLRQIFVLLYPQGRGGLYHCVDGPGGTQRCTDLDDACGAPRGRQSRQWLERRGDARLHVRLDGLPIRDAAAAAGPAISCARRVPMLVRA